MSLNLPPIPVLSEKPNFKAAMRAAVYNAENKKKEDRKKYLSQTTLTSSNTQMVTSIPTSIPSYIPLYNLMLDNLSLFYSNCILHLDEYKTFITYNKEFNHYKDEKKLLKALIPKFWERLTDKFKKEQVDPISQELKESAKRRSELLPVVREYKTVAHQLLNESKNKIPDITLFTKLLNDINMNITNNIREQKYTLDTIKKIPDIITKINSIFESNSIHFDQNNPFCKKLDEPFNTFIKSIIHHMEELMKLKLDLNNSNYKNKYLKYKSKYLALKKLINT